MTKKNWQDLLKRLQVVTRMGELTPVVAAELDAFEKSHGIKLPKSYRAFCDVFGAGEFGEEFKIAVPGYAGAANAYSLPHLDNGAHNGLDYEVYSKNPAQHKRGLFFATDILRSYHFFDPEECTNKRLHEYAVYTLFKDFTIQRTADNFWLFITECCLGEKHDLLIKGSPPDKLFMPVTV